MRARVAELHAECGHSTGGLRGVARLVWRNGSSRGRTMRALLEGESPIKTGLVLVYAISMIAHKSCFDIKGQNLMRCYLARSFQC